MAHARDVDHHGGGEHRADADVALAELAQRQHGFVTRAQLLDLGLGRRAIDRRLERRRLHIEHRGVYAVGHRPRTSEARWMAAVLAAGTGAVLSHRSAAALWGIRPTARVAVEVTMPVERRPGRGIETHRSRLPVDEVTVLDGIPVTTVPRTLLDLAAVVSTRQVERALNEAEVLCLRDPLSLDMLLRRYPRRRGSRAIRAALEGRGGGATVTRSELEERFLDLLDGAGLPRPEVNVLVAVGQRTFEVDCLWRSHALVVELDGRVTHGTSVAFERDRERDRVLQAAGWRPVRITWHQLHDAPRAVEDDLRRLLSAANLAA